MTVTTEDRLGPLAEAAINEVVSLASASGYFDRIQQAEPKSPPGTGLTFATWVQSIKPIALRSGLDVTSARFVVTTRIYLSMLAEPQDMIDVNATKASSWMMAQYNGNFQTADNVWIDLLGAHGIDIESKAGYLPLGGKMYRIMDTMVPFIAEDVWAQGSEE